MNKNKFTNESNVKEVVTKEKFVETIKGESLPISKTRKYEAGFYKIGDVNVENSGDCYLMKNGSYYRVETGQIVYDHTSKSYVQNNSLLNLTNGIVDSSLKIGYFQKNINTITVRLPSGERRRCIGSEVMKDNLDYREILSSGDYDFIGNMKAREFSVKRKPSSDYKNSLPYDSKGIIGRNMENYNKLYTPSKPLENESEILKIIKDLSFGLEFESIAGQIPKNICNKLGLMPLRDGSISGIEYVTIPLSGSKGISNIIDSVYELNRRTKYDDSCAMHLHLGNVPRTPEFLTAFFKLTLGVQDEIFKMFNLYKKYNFKYKNKNYSAPYDTFRLLSKLDPVITDKNLIKNFDVIFTELSEGYPLRNFGDTGDLSKIDHHPRDPHGNQKWNISSRYHIHNLIPIIFGNKQTIEFRIHTPTYDIDKIMAFLCINSILVNFCIQNTKQILDGTIDSHTYSLTNIINNYGIVNGVSLRYISRLIKYVEGRKNAVEFQNRKGTIYFKEEEVPCIFEYDQKLQSNTEGFSLSYLDFSDMKFNTFKATSSKPLKTGTSDVYIVGSNAKSTRELRDKALDHLRDLQGSQLEDPASSQKSWDTFNTSITPVDLPPPPKSNEYYNMTSEEIEQVIKNGYK